MTTEEGCVECDATAVALRTALPPTDALGRSLQAVATAQEQAQPGPSQAQRGSAPEDIDQCDCCPGLGTGAYQA